jgi:prepilin-type N-terminal cleavage/methylation domain-containing protein
MKSIIQKGFTLIELLVVIAIIGLLATLATVSFSGSTKKARDAKRKSDLIQVQKALELYYDDHNAYPSTAGAWWGTSSVYGNRALTGANGWVPNLAPQYLGKLPSETHPIATNSSCPADLSWSTYLYRSDGTSYKLLAFCSIEGPAPAANEAFYDPMRQGIAFALCNLGGAGCGW